MSRLAAWAVSLLCAMLVPACATISVSDLPQIGKTYNDGYDIVLEFESVLNLPDRAKVIMDGNEVGVVKGVSVIDSAVEVTARIDRAVAVPVDAYAVLQQATVLGDIYVALERIPETRGTAPALSAGGRIPLAQTESPPSLEDTIAQLAHFVASGSIQRIQNTIINVNRVTPERSEQVRAIASRVSVNLRDLSQNIETVDTLLDSLHETSSVAARRTPQLQFWFSPDGMLLWDRLLEESIGVGVLLPSIGSIYTGGYWLVPLLESLGITLGEVQKSKWAIEGEYRPWRELFREMFLPQDKYPAMNITSVQTSDGRDITGGVEDVLRMLGAIR